MTPGDWIAIATVGGTLAGALIGYGVVWGAARASLKSLKTSHNNLKTDFISHKDNRQIHIDPERDGAAEAELKEFMTKRFDKIDDRCEKRGDTCVRHFARIEGRIAAVTGKSNGESS